MESRKSYSDKEKVLLATLIQEHGSIIENKKTDSASIQEKHKAWLKVAELYNVQPESHIHRSAKQLKKLWDNLKQKKRKQVTNEKHILLLTGGGPEQDIPIDPLMELIGTVAPHADVDVECIWDSTAIYENKKKEEQSSSCSQVQPATTSAPSKVPFNAGVASTSTAPSTPVRAVVNKNTKSSTIPANTGNDTVRDERYWRTLKAIEGVAQQKELHAKRMETARDEASLAALKLSIFKEENNIK